jgi:hypothetical protein
MLCVRRALDPAASLSRLARATTGFTYQRQIRSAEYVQTLTETFRDRIGPDDFSKVTEFATWLAHHPKGRDICCYLLDNLDQKNEP